MPSSYNKPFRTYDEQVRILTERGLAVEDFVEAVELLRSIGYYTLGGYLYPMREIAPGGGGRLDTFAAAASMSQVGALYRFDRELRLLCLDALERIERAIKVAVAYEVGQLDKFAHDSGTLHNPKYLQPTGNEKTSAHKVWKDTHKGKVMSRTHDSIQAFANKYGYPLPIWVAIDAMDFGDISKLIEHLGSSTKTALARKFQIRRGKDFASWVRTMCLVRNISAHHDRLWNRELSDVPTQPKGPEAACFLEVRHEQQLWSRTYMALLIIAYFMRTIEPTTNWGHRMGVHLQTLPTAPGIEMRALGAPPTWAENLLWGL